MDETLRCLRMREDIYERSGRDWWRSNRSTSLESFWNEVDHTYPPRNFKAEKALLMSIPRFMSITHNLTAIGCAYAHISHTLYEYIDRTAAECVADF